MPDFNNTTPPKNVTNPNPIEGALYPRHLYKHVAEPTDISMVVAWNGKVPIHNEYVVVGSEPEQDAKVGEGYALEPVLKAPAEKAEKKAAK